MRREEIARGSLTPSPCQHNDRQGYETANYLLPSSCKSTRHLWTVGSRKQQCGLCQGNRPAAARPGRGGGVRGCGVPRGPGQEGWGRPAVGLEAQGPHSSWSPTKPMAQAGMLPRWIQQAERSPPLDSHFGGQPFGTDGGKSAPLPPLNPAEDRFPFCLVWSPLPVIGWLVPFIGHVGICRSDGTILDFAGSYFINVGAMAFGSPSRVLRLSPAQVSYSRFLAASNVRCKEMPG